MLQHIGYCIAWGYPTAATVRKLIYRRGYAKVNGQRIRLTNNEIVQSQLGDRGFLCVEDVINEIVQCGTNFKQANNFLWPFKLSSPSGGLHGKKRHSYVNGGVWGNREEDINSLVALMDGHK